MKNLIKLRKQLAEKAQEARAIHTAAQDDGNRSLTSEEETRFNELMQEVDQRRAEIRREEQLQELDAEDIVNQEEEGLEEGQWRSFGEFIRAVRFNPMDPRLVYRDTSRQGANEKRDMQMDVGELGGFAVPTEFRPGILEITPQEAIMRPRATVIPAGGAPDTSVSMVALDQSGARGVYSGVVVEWIEEGGDKPETEPRLREIGLTPHEVAGHTVVTDKLLRNSDAIGPMLERLLRRAIIATEDTVFWTGDGVGKPLGIVGHPATIVVDRDTADQVNYVDLTAMYSQMKFGGQLVWIASPTVLPQLMNMVDAGNRLIWQPNARDGAPGTLLGLPVLLNERSPVLGDEGDLALVDPDYYLIKDGFGIAIDASSHVLFRENKTVIKAFWNVDGQPWLTTPLLLEDGQSRVSPFVVLGG